MSRPAGRTDVFSPLNLSRLLALMAAERRQARTLFGLHENLCLFSLAGRSLGVRRDGRFLEAPIGVAAGPHTQLAPNLVAAWLCGARWLELKTVQHREASDLPRPCIDMTDEGYNCEWSQELPLDVSYDQYADAWTAIRLLQREAGIDPADEPGFALDLSVGYDLAGIRSAPMQRFLDRVADAAPEIEARLAAARKVLTDKREIPVPAVLATSVTLSTMHGCPPEEIERIGRFLLEERGLHTAIKLNPTLLGPDAVRELLNARLGYAVAVDSDAFAQDPDFAQIVDMLRGLRAVAARVGLRCGVKLTNTLPCLNADGALPAEVRTRYLSGRALHPIAVAAAANLQEAFGGDLDISFAGGADAFNVVPLLRCGLGPVTACSDLLRPGGVQRLRQYLETIEAAVLAAGCTGPDELAGPARGESATHGALDDLRAYAAATAADPRYRRDAFADRSIRTARPLELFDCAAAPCVGCCPTGQDIPGYMHHTARGQFAAALAVVRADNPLPTTAGMVCDHPCQQKCTRVNYEAPVRIRDVKRFLAENATPATASPPPAPSGRRVAVVGAGPAGLACARTLARAGVAVEVYEARDTAGGMITDVIPRFRLDSRHFARDLQEIEALGVVIRYGARVDAARFRQLREGFDAVFVAVGAAADAQLGIPGEDLPGVVPALPFLAQTNREPDRELAGEVAVIGGGDSAMDAARTAARLTGDGGSVRLLYRRRTRDMPADPEEIEAVRAEGVKIHELLAPLAIAAVDGRLRVTCAVMRPGPPDASGRPRPEAVRGRAEDHVVDTVVVAVGQRVVCDFLDESVAATARDDAAHGLGGVYVGGDMRAGPANLVSALGDGRRAAEAMLRSFGLPVPGSAQTRPRLPEPERQARAARLVLPRRPAVHRPTGRGDFDLALADLSAEDARAEAARCLECDLVCDVCVSVCPNRANFSWTTRPRRLSLVAVLPRDGSFVTVPDGEFVVLQERQTGHVVDFCNHCGNCTTFCPTSGSPFRDKPRLALADAAWEAEDDILRLERDGRDLRLRRRRHGREQSLTRRADVLVWESAEAVVELSAASLGVRNVLFRQQPARGFGLREAATLAVLLDGLTGPGGESWLVS